MNVKTMETYWQSIVTYYQDIWIENTFKLIRNAKYQGTQSLIGVDYHMFNYTLLTGRRE